MAQSYDSSDPVVLEGVYKSIASSVGEVRQSVSDVQEAVSKELQYNSAQQVAAYEALIDAFEQGMESLRAELRYVAQQSSTIFEYDQIGTDKLRADLLEAVKTETEAAEKRTSEKLQTALEDLVRRQEELEHRQEERIQRLRADMLAAFRGMGPRAEGDADVATEILDGYDVHDEIDEVRSIAEETRDLINSLREDMKEKPAEETTEETATAEQESSEITEEALDYDVLAEKIVSIMPEIDYDMLSDKVASAIPQTDAEAVAERVAQALGTLDENAIADRVAEAIPLIDYDLIAERVADVIKGEEPKSETEEAENAEAAEQTSADVEDRLARVLEEKFDYDKIARCVVDILNNETETEDESESEERIASAVEEKLDYERIAKRVAELLKGTVITVPVVQTQTEEHTEELAAAEEPAPAAEPIPEPVAEPVIITPVPVPAKAKKEKKEEPKEEEMTVRYKYSFTAKIITSDMEVKQYYSQLKNEFMSYPNTSSQINWANDRFSYDNETIAKVAVRGKTLCLYLALDPNELPESVYHQTFAGDTTMYEKTPTMVKIKSGVALKRALRLIGLLMEKYGAVAEEPKSVDYASQFAYRTEEQLLQEGLVKAVAVKKSESDFVRK